MEFDFMSDYETEQADSEANPEPEPDLYETEFERLKDELNDLDRAVSATLLHVIKSGTATPGHLNVARQFLKDKGFTLPEMIKRERSQEHAGLLGDIDMPFGNA
jgi:hypothetical protein